MDNTDMVSNELTSKTLLLVLFFYKEKSEVYCWFHLIMWLSTS